MFRSCFSLQLDLHNTKKKHCKDSLCSLISFSFLGFFSEYLFYGVVSLVIKYGEKKF